MPRLGQVGLRYYERDCYICCSSYMWRTYVCMYVRLYVCICLNLLTNYLKSRRRHRISLNLDVCISILRMLLNISTELIKTMCIYILYVCIIEEFQSDMK